VGLWTRTRAEPYSRTPLKSNYSGKAKLLQRTTPTPMAVVSVAVAMAMMVKPTTAIATPHHRTTNANETTTTKTEIEFTTRKRMRMERSIPKLARTRTTRTRTRTLSRTPKLVGSAHRGVLRPVPVRSVGAGRVIMVLAVVVGGALDKTRGCIQMRMRGGRGRNRRVPKVSRSRWS
jgi:hypothetical protein